jgi:hypothetical protein
VQVKITKSQLRQIIKEEIIKELLPREQLDEGVWDSIKAAIPKSRTEVLLGLGILAGMGGFGAHVNHQINQDNAIQKALEDASPQDLKKAQRALRRWIGKRNVDGTLGNAQDWIEHHKKAGTSGFGTNTDKEDFQ